MARQGLRIGDEPRLHALDHQVGVIVIGTVGLPAVVAGRQMLPGAVALIDRAFAVDQQDADGISGLPNFSGKVLQGFVSATAGNDFWLAAGRNDLAEKFTEALSARDGGRAGTAAFDKYVDGYHRVPPI